MNIIEELEENSFKVESRNGKTTTLVDAIPLFTVKRFLSDILTELRDNAQNIGDDIDTDYVDLKDIERILAGVIKEEK